jgi:hypothetical protein
MKTKLHALVFCLFISSSLLAQGIRVLDANEYDILKKANQLPEKFMLKKAEGSQTVLLPRVQPSFSVQSNATCNCLLPLDASYSVVPFTNGIAPDYRNDDGSSPLISLPFSFCLFGQPMTSIYINNNGNISFGSSYSTYSAAGFPSGAYVMVAPFWADVDTRDSLSGLVYYKVTPNALIVKWEHVGYYANQSDKLNTFQLIITDGTDPLVAGGSNTSFCFGDMQWTTGSASGGTNGFGGTPATVGANFGDGINFIQFGRFDQPGYTFDGGGGSNDGVDWLDSSGFVFDLCPFNIPPVALDCNSDTVLLHPGDTIDIDLSFSAAEVGQIATISVNAGGLANLTTISNTSGNIAHYVGQLVADISNLGNNSFSVTATDDGTPAQSTTVNRVYQIAEATGIQQNNFSPTISFSPNPFTDQTVLTVSGINGRNISLVVTDVTGREVKRTEHISSSLTIEKGNLTKGIYFYQVTDGSSVNEKGKLVIQ